MAANGSIKKISAVKLWHYVRIQTKGNGQARKVPKILIGLWVLNATDWI